MKCASQNGSLAKPIPEYTYAVIQREFLCDCQLDLKHASVLHRLNACSGSKPQNLVMKFFVNLAFWEMLKKHHAQLAEKVQPKVDFVEQTFNVRLFDDDKDPLNKATDMLHMINKMDEDGKKCEKKKAELEDPSDGVEIKLLLPKFLANILIVVCSVLSTMATLVVILILVKYCKTSSMVATLVVASQLPPPAPATLQLPGSVGIMYTACHTLIDGLQSTGVIDGMPCNLFHGLKRAVESCVTLFNKVHNDTDLIPPLGPLMQVQKPTEKPEKTFDTVSINCNGVRVLEDDEPIPMPASVPILLKHKVKTRIFCLKTMKYSTLSSRGQTS